MRPGNFESFRRGGERVLSSKYYALGMQDKMGRELSSGEVLQKATARLGNIFLEFEVMLLRWLGHIPSHTLRKFFYRLAGVKIGNGSTIHMWCNFYDPRGVSIGEDTIV